MLRYGALWGVTVRCWPTDRTDSGQRSLVTGRI